MWAVGSGKFLVTRTPKAQQTWRTGWHFKPYSRVLASEHGLRVASEILLIWLRWALADERSSNLPHLSACGSPAMASWLPVWVHPVDCHSARREKFAIAKGW